MFKHKNFKIHVHHNLSVAYKNPKTSKNKVFRIFLLPFLYLYSFCYFVGLSLILTSQKISLSIIKEFKSTWEHLKKRRQNFLKSQTYKSLATFTVLIAVVIIGFKGMNFLTYALEVKKQIENVSLLGTYQLKNAKIAFSENDIESAQSSLFKAYKNFNFAQKTLNESSTDLRLFLKVIPKAKDGQNLVEAATLLSEAGLYMFEFSKQAETLKFSTGGFSAENSASKTFEEMIKTLNTINSKVVLANKKITGINENILPENDRANFLQLKATITTLSNSLTSLTEFFSSLKYLTTGKKSILFVFENNNEMRGAGGFIGSFGLMQMDDGKIKALNISSVYDLDGQLDEFIKPPMPIFAVNNRWYLRDSNWFADFPTSAKKIIGFYEKEGGDTPDLVVALTPNLIISLLKITGPVTLPHYNNLTLNAENFIEETEAVSSVSINSNENKPKQIFSDLFPILVQKLSSLEKENAGTLIEALHENLLSKHLVMYSNQGELQSYFKNLYWSGESTVSDRDYISINESNLGGTKTSLSIKQNVSLKTLIATDGTITNTLEIKRKNLLPTLEKTFNKSFLRIFVPEGSELLEDSGFDFIALESNQDNKFKTDPDVYAWERQSVKSVISGTIIGKEAGKTFFGNWSILNGGEEKTIKLVYKLPFKLNKTDRYSMLMQKQIGGKSFYFSHNLNFPSRQIVWSNINATNIEKDYLNFESEINKDSFYGVVLKYD